MLNLIAEQKKTDDKWMGESVCRITAVQSGMDTVWTGERGVFH